MNVGGVPSGRVTERIIRQQQAGTIKTAGSTCELNITMAGILSVVVSNDRMDTAKLKKNKFFYVLE